MPDPTRQRFHSREEGAALVMVLLVALLVTVLGLGLLFVTEMENTLGGSEKVRTAGAVVAETGIHAALGAVMVSQDWGGEEVTLEERDLGARKLGHRVRTSRIQGVGAPLAPPLTIANEGQREYHSFSVVLRTTSERVSWPSSEASPIYEDGDLREDDVIVQAQTAQTVRYLLSPLREPSSPGEVYDGSREIGID